MMQQISSIKYDKLIIYYFSGTGNSRNAAFWILQIAQKNGIQTEIIDISKNRKYYETDKNIRTLVGFCAPTHGFNFPPVMFHFLLKLPLVKNVDCFIVNSRAGMKLYKIFLPGLSGLAQFFSALICIIKGFRVVGMQPIDLPSNWISLHPGLRKKVVNSLFERCKIKIEKFANDILSGKKRYKALLSLPVDLLITPVAVLYYLIGRFFLAKTFVSTDKCTGCGLCVKQCPIQAIHFYGNRPYWSFSCESCMRCMNNCPERAIETAHTLIFAFFFLGLLFIDYIFVNVISELSLYQNLPETIKYLIFNTFQFLFLLLMFWSGYKIIYFLSKYKVLSIIIRVTSLTHFKFWRRYNTPKNDKNE